MTVSNRGTRLTASFFVMHKVQLNVSTINKTATSGTEESAATVERCSL